MKLYNYAFFHCLSEIFSIVVAFGIFTLSWNSRRYSDNNYFLFIGIAFLYIGIVDLIHTLAYKGMGIFTGYDANLPTQLWIAGRYIQSISFLAAPFSLDRKLKTNYAFLGYTAVITILFLSLFSWHNFPACFIEGSGLTPFKVFSEYVISLILLLSIVLLLKKKEKIDRRVRRLIIVSILTTIASEMSFTLYTDVYGFFNAVGHFLKIIAFFLIYKAIIEIGIERPYDILYRNLRLSEEHFRELFNTMSSGIVIYQTQDDGENFIITNINPAGEKIS